MVDPNHSTILLLAQLRAGSGNQTTADRIRGHFTSSGYTCLMRDPITYEDITTFSEYVRNNNVALVLAINARVCCRLLKVLVTLEVPYILVFGGTDVNCQDLVDADTVKDIHDVVLGARYTVAFTPRLLEDATKIWNGLDHQRSVLIPQGISVCQSDFRLHDHIKEQLMQQNTGNHLTSTQGSLHIFTLVAGIRPVKDPLYLVHAFSEWHSTEQPSAYLVIIGDILDKTYGARFTATIHELPGVLFLGPLGIADCHAAMMDSVAVVNSSESEGMSAAILEAMLLKVPVIARNVSGNAAVISHDQTGLLYDTPQDFLQCASRLLSDDKLHERISREALSYVTSTHSEQTEREHYLNLVHQTLNGSQTQA